MSEQPNNYVFTLEQTTQNINVAKDILIDFMAANGYLNQNPDVLKANIGILIFKKGLFGEMFDKVFFGEKGNLRMQVLQIAHATEETLRHPQHQGKVLQLVREPEIKPEPHEPTGDKT